MWEVTVKVQTTLVYQANVTSLRATFDHISTLLEGVPMKGTAEIMVRRIM